MKVNSQVEDWHIICNMRSTLLQLQYLCSSISEQVEQQANRFDSIQKDRLLQLEQLYAKNKEMSVRNFKIILIAKLEDLLAHYVNVDEQIWGMLTKFSSTVAYMEQEMARDVCKLYLGSNVMLDIGKCQSHLLHLHQRLQLFVQQHKQSIHDYNKGIAQLQQLQRLWINYLQQLQSQIKQQIQPSYPKYLRKRLQAKQRQLQASINELKKFITS